MKETNEWWVLKDIAFLTGMSMSEAKGRLTKLETIGFIKRERIGDYQFYKYKESGLHRYKELELMLNEK
jgi:DNA-binding transcriptional regulator PaaX